MTAKTEIFPATTYLFRRWLEKLAAIGLSENDLTSIFAVNPAPPELQTHFQVINGKNQGQIGKVLGTIGFKHAAGYEVVLRLSDGKTIAVPPMWLVPAPADESVIPKE